MQVQSTPQQGGSELYELCSQFEQVLVASLVPRPLSDAASADDDEPAVDTIGSGQTNAIFAQALSSALERAGGLGLGRELYRMLEERGA